MGVADVERVPCAGVVHVVLLVVLHQPVVGRVVDAAHRQRRAHVVSLGGVVVDHVEDHLDAGQVQFTHHGLEFLDLLAVIAHRTVGVVRSEEADGVVAPVVREALFLQRAVIDELVHRHELDRGDAELLQVRDHRRVRHTGVGSALLLGNVRVQLGEALDVRLVDDRLVVRRARHAVAVPVEERVHHHAQHHVRGGVLVVDRVLVTEVVAEEGLVPVELARHRLRVGVEEELVRVAAVTLGRVVRAVDPVAVLLARRHVRQVAVPDVTVHFLQLDAGFRAVVVEQAEHDRIRDLAVEGEVRSRAVIGRAQGVRVAGP